MYELKNWTMTQLAIRILFGCLLLLIASCGNLSGMKETTDIKGEKSPVRVERDGLNIEYHEAGQGDTSLLFVHGWGINKEYWNNQVSYFSDRYRVVVPDLPGFGKSGKLRSEWTVEQYGDDITALIQSLGLHNVLLVGHSMSGAIVLDAAIKNPNQVIGIVGVDNFKNLGAVPTEAEKAQSREYFSSMRSNYTSFVKEMAGNYLFSVNTDSMVKLRVITDISGSDSVIAVISLERNEEYPLARKLKEYGKPLYLINSDYFPTDTLALKKLKLPYKLYSVGTTGHYPMIEAAERFNHALDSVLTSRQAAE
jgi:pimeloyl-ACP methyl ester carboxylesterase